MKNTRLLMFVLGGSLVTATGLVVACSDEEAAIVVDAGNDAPTPPPSDAGTTSDVKEKPPFDAGFKPETYDTDLGTAACETLARCCWGNPHPADGGIDGGSFNLTKCLADFRIAGFDSSNQDLARADASVVVVDQVKASECVLAIRSLACTINGPIFTDLREKCFGALYGTVPPGGACNYSIECVPGTFCKTTLLPDGGVGAPGACEPLRAAGDSCGDFTNDQYIADQACSYRGDGQTKRFCQNVVDFDTLNPTDESQWKCQAALPNDAGCALTTWCASGVCDFTAKKCVDTLDFYPQSSCRLYLSQ